MNFTEALRNIGRRRWVRRVVGIVGIIFLVLIISVGTFVARCSNVQKQFVPVHDEISSGQKILEESIEGYVRTEESTYITYPEWYLVFNPQEYAEFLVSNRPSMFPYFASIGQFWSGYCQVYGITEGEYPFNAENHLVEVVIGVSFTVEYALKGVYENTIGRVSELVSGGDDTSEDVYAAKIAKEYGDFIPTDPWYAFPFDEAFVGVWKETDLWGKDLTRKWERKLFLSLEYGVKALYAKAIGFGTHATLGVADTEIYAHVAAIPHSVLSDPKIRVVKELADGSFIITMPHYQGFTDTIPGLAKQGLQFLDISGNDEILLTAIAPADWDYDFEMGKDLFSMPILTNSEQKRIAIQAPIKSLSDILNQLDYADVRIEHLFDY